MELFRTFTSEQNFNIGCFDYCLAVLISNTHTHSEPVHIYIHTKYVLIYTQNCHRVHVVEMSYIKVLFTGESPKQLQCYSMNARTMTFSEHNHTNPWSNVASCELGDFLGAKVLVAS